MLMKKHKKMCVVVPVVVVLLTLAAVFGYTLGNSTENSFKTEAAGASEQVSVGMSYDSAANVGEKMAVADVTDAGGGNSAATALIGENQALSGRKLIKNVSMDVQTKSFDELVAYVREQAEGLNGYVESASVSGQSYEGENGGRYASLAVRIPSDSLEAYTKAVGGQCNVLNMYEDVQDVTLTYVDLESHIKVLETERERLIELLSKAETVEDMMAVETRLSDIRYELESYESQLKVYDNQIDYSTVRISISEVAVMDYGKGQSAFERMKEGFIGSLMSIGRGIKAFCINAVIGLPYITIAVVLLLVVFFVGRKWYRRARKSLEDSPVPEQEKEDENREEKD